MVFASFVGQSYPSAGMERGVNAGEVELEGSSRSPGLVVESSLKEPESGPRDGAGPRAAMLAALLARRWGVVWSDSGGGEENGSDDEW